MDGEWGHFECGWKQTLDTKMVSEDAMWEKNGEWGHDMKENSRVEKIQIVMVSEDIL